MKRILALLLVLLMLLSCFASCGSKKENGKTNESAGTGEDAPTEELPLDRGDANKKPELRVTPANLVISIRESKQLNTRFTPNFKNDSTDLRFKSADNAVAVVEADGTVTGIRSGLTTITVTDTLGEFKTEVAVTVLPKSSTLQGSVHVPPVDNQGNIGSCAHESVTYAQFNIAVSQYLHSLNPNTDWNPSSGELRYLFSPKFTINFSGAGTEYAYRILMEHGVLTENYSRFYHQGEASLSGPETAPYKETASWDVSEGLLDVALNYRVTNFDEIDYSGAYSGNLTTGGDHNLDLFKRVKNALIDGNAVVICGWSSYWNYGKISQNGEIGKKNESCIVSAANPNNGSGDGNHAVTIVGYDDTIEAKYGGITLKGAFQVLNSWGSGYENDGYVWMMYDAFNTKSEYEILNNPDVRQTFVYVFDDGGSFKRFSSVKTNTMFDFTATGTVTVGEKEYTTYSIFNPETKEYLGYTSIGGNMQIRMTSAATDSVLTNWAMIPYNTLIETPAEGYEDAFLLFACDIPGATLDGPFCIKNTDNQMSFGKATADNTAFCFTLSDHVNTKVTEFVSAIQVTDSVVSTRSKAERTSTIYRFSFLDWRTDIAIGEKYLRVEAEVSTTTRENFKIDLLRVDATGNLTVHRPMLFKYGADGMHDEYMGEGVRNKLSFSGVVEPTKPESGYFTLSYHLMGTLPEGTDFDNFLWGIRISGDKSNIKRLKLIAPNGTILASLHLDEQHNTVMLNEETRERGQKDYLFDLGDELRTFATDGSFYLKNLGTGKYIGYRASLFKEAEIGGTTNMLFKFTTDPITKEFILYDQDEQGRLDVYDKDSELGEGLMVKLNNTSPNRGATQDWVMVTNADGTISFHLKAHPEYYFGYDPEADGPSKYVLLTDKDSDYCKWTLTAAGDIAQVIDVSFSGQSATVSANKPEGYSESSATLRVTTADGSTVSEQSVTFAGDKLNATVSGLKANEIYMFVLTGADGKDLFANYIVKCP